MNQSTKLGAYGDRLGWLKIAAYSAPTVGVGYMYLLIGLYIMKFSTDVLLISPAIMGTIFGVSRVWDAISDPLVGYYSDKTQSSLGRRRSWLLLSMLPIAAMFVMVFSPPASLTGAGLVVWMAVGVIGFYSAMTLFMVPHLSMGPELSSDYHERSRLYGFRHAAYTVGSIIALISMQLLINAEQVSEAQVRDTAFELSALAGIVTALLIAVAVVKLKERPDYQGRVGQTPFGAFKDVWGNPHARLVIVVTFIENIGSAVIALLTLYVCQYVVGTPSLAPLIILTYMIPSSLSVPLWIPLSRRVGKIRLWMFSMMLTGLSFGGMFVLPFLDAIEDRTLVIFVLAFFAGLSAGCGGTIAPSVQSDIIDYDEFKTGERKEGSYFAAFNFVQKSATGVMILITGWVLELSGFMPNVEQTFTVQIAIVTLYGLSPLICYTIGTVLFSKFTLDALEHQRIKAVIDARE
ncbi:MAG: MFS transporter [Proteobacteria bacterium]|nr:MFS transporter [Pseudomonadota bacterium]MDA0958155.1 MFS transporter [Pseudomonadota bacterium]